MILVFTGNGKGKTTSCLGHMVRMTGYGKRAIMFQFIKGEWTSGEHLFVKSPTYKGKFEIVQGGKGFVGILGDKKLFSTHQKEAHETLEKIHKAILSKKWDMIVLDEINVAVELKLLRASEVLTVIKDAPTSCTIILSGRNAPKSFITHADYVSEIQEVKHPYQKGKLAEKGVDY